MQWENSIRPPLVAKLGDGVRLIFLKKALKTNFLGGNAWEILIHAD
jgi:hypothetical protein